MVFRQRQTIVAPIGLVTQPNAYGVYPSGALRRAENVTLRNVGELVQMPSTFDQVVVGPRFGSELLHRLMPLDAGHVYAMVADSFNCSIWENGNAVSIPSSSTNMFNRTGRTSPARVRERWLLNSAYGYLVGDYMAPTTPAERALRFAGMVQPSYYTINVTTTNANAIQGHTLVGYCACLLRRFADGYFIRSVPSPIFKYVNSTGTYPAATPPPVNLVLLVNLANASSYGTIAGDFIELYRTDAVPALGNVDGYQTDPGQTLKLVQTYVITAADLTAGYATIVDSQSSVLGTNVTPGDELYTNPYQEGPSYSNRQPPIAACTAAFKGYVFYARTTDRPALSFKMPGGIGSEPIALATFGIPTPYFSAYALGYHQGAGTITLGSPTITAVSAADLVGITIGQQWGYAIGYFPSNATVIAVGATTITMSTNAAGAGATFAVADVIEVGGQRIPFFDAGTLVRALSSAGYEVTTKSVIQTPSQITYDTGQEITIEPQRFAFSPFTITVRATNGARYSPALPEITATPLTILPNTLRNHLVWSKEQQPEHVPPAHETFVGNAEIIALNPTRDALWIWCTDGLYRLSGNGGSDGLGWGLDIVSTTLILAAPQASSVLGEVVYGYTNQGFVGVDSAGNVEYLTDQRIGNLLPGAQYVETRTIICEANETDDEVLLGLGENGNTHSDVIWVYNVKQKGWTTIKAAASATSLRNITTMAMMRSTASGEPRLLFGVSPLAGGFPSYSGWNGPTYLQAAVEYQPVYGDDPLSLKQYIWCDYLFASGGAGKTLVPLYNGVAAGQVTLTDFQNGGYARSGVPRRFAVAHSISVGFEQLVVGVEELALVGQARFQGISLALAERTNQSKKR